jgi:hypothetical protein
MPAQPMQYQPGQPAMVGAPGALVPPGMHWFLVLVLGTVTFGIFTIIWVFKQANFVQRIDPSNPARKLFTIMILLLVVYVAIVAGAVVAQSTEAVATVGAIGGLVDLGMAALSLIAIFKMRTSLLNYYNSVEPIGLRLSGVMTFFFNIYYFQYHFHRIAQWKQTGMLVPQR